ncbi:hypothetical protein SCNRRL3882_3579 [Streptomyces chartreusis NRRL 3882]|uniref:Uncharacterized protein n=2 Tax=Streptomyces TaxID=1883 RepID=A0A2N9B9U5_STRCX|nr:hypothetical protein SCNRRL3882_3579 [Streptomyces chartreusis NRRL 3882]
MTAKEIYQVSLEIDPRLAQMTSLINESFPHGVGLTTVGSVIGNAYMRIPPGETEERGNSLG